MACVFFPDLQDWGEIQDPPPHKKKTPRVRAQRTPAAPRRWLWVSRPPRHLPAPEPPRSRGIPTQGAGDEVPNAMPGPTASPRLLPHCLLQLGPCQPLCQPQHNQELGWWSPVVVTSP